MDTLNKRIKQIINSMDTDSVEPIILFEDSLKIISDYTFDDDEKKDQQVENLIFKIILKEVKPEIIDETDRYMSYLFDKKNSIKTQKYVAACFIRLLLHNDKLIEGSPFLKRKFIDLVENNYSNRKWIENSNYSTKDDIDSKISKIKAIVSGFEYKLYEGIPISNIFSMNKFRSDFSKMLHHHYYSDVIKFFLPTEILTKSNLNIIFEDIKAYNESPVPSKVSTYKKALDNLNKFLESASEYDTVYSEHFVIKNFNKLKNLLIIDFNESPYCKPVSFSVNQLNKKYPLNQTNLIQNFPITLVKHGEGIAYSVMVEVKCNDSDFKLIQNNQELTQFNTPYITLNFQGKLINPVEELTLDIIILWNNIDDTDDEYSNTLKIRKQRTDIDWKELSERDPYNSEPIDDDTMLVGRDAILKRLFAKTTGKRVSSVYIYGQKRVGKTSIAKSLLRKISKEDNEKFITIYKETGDYQTTSSDIGETVSYLGELICTEIKNSDERYNHLQVPEFNGSFNRLSGFLDSVIRVTPNKKILIVLDEFDEIDPILYQKGKIGDAFFLTIRAISNKGNIGFILVGGEKMAVIVSCQGEQINKFISQKVDYFERQEYLTDYAELIKKPVEEFEYENDSIELLYEYTSGNPFFTKQICEVLYENCVASRDSHVTTTEVTKAIEIALERAAPNLFAHFWEDGIREKEEKEEIISMNRKKLLLTIGRLLSQDKKTTKSMILDMAVTRGLTEVDAESILKEFIDRRIIKEDNDNYRLVVRYFEEWLKNYGIEKIIQSFSDEEKIKAYKKIEEEASVKSKEILGLVKEWPPYNGKPIFLESFRVWIDQFTNPLEQRLIFNLMKHLRIYDETELNASMTTLFKEMSKRLKTKNYYNPKNIGSKTGKQLRRMKRKDIIVSYLDGLSKSGAEYAKRFADENNVFYDRVVAPSKIYSMFQKNKNDLIGIVFIDDFSGTGGTLKDKLENFYTENKALFEEFTFSIHIGVVTGFMEAKNKLESTIELLGINAYVYFHNLLNEQDKVFSNESNFFDNYAAKEKTKNVVTFYGQKLVKKYPLGFGDCQTLIVFPSTCPNNSLPILWQERDDWIPLFKRKT